MPAHAQAERGAARFSAEEVKITITTPQLWLRNAPSVLAGNVASVKKGEFYLINARTEDGAWWRLSVPGAKTNQTWMLADLGALYSGKLDDVPVVAATLPAPSAAKLGAFPSWIPQITPAQRALYQRAVSVGKDPGMFTVVGDCNSLPPIFLQRIAAGQYNVAALGGLQRTVQVFNKSFSRISLAANGGFNAKGMMDPAWAPGNLCDVKNGAGPLACELWISRASVAFIALGTQEQYEWKDFEKNYRPLIEHTLSKGVLPVLVTKADDIETASGAGPGTINAIIRKLAAEYQVPLLDFHAATRDLPNKGLIDEGDKDFHLSYAGMDRRMLTTLQTLAAITGK
ncbi:MAG: SGNH/GDSL hydrolase family protein [Anaerolineae bacterium]|nr:SGNH/GDSL hydrolase family protein [Anaerolineae bacterium]